MTIKLTIDGVSLEAYLDKYANPEIGATAVKNELGEMVKTARDNVLRNRMVDKKRIAEEKEKTAEALINAMMRFCEVNLGESLDQKSAAFVKDISRSMLKDMEDRKSEPTDIKTILERFVKED